jgi:hypothetical protein
MGASICSVVALLAGCSSNQPPPTTTAPIGKINLSQVCPSNLVVQTDWYPTADHGHLYELFGPDPQIDADRKVVKGPLYSESGYTGISLEVRAGGPAIGYQSVEGQMYTDKSINLGYVPLANAITTSASTPVTAVFAGLDKSPLIVMWDPKTYPNVKTIKELGETKAVVLYYNGQEYMQYLTQSGLLKSSQIDGSYDGMPANFVAAGGKNAQQDYVTNGVYTYEHEIENWDRPVAYQLVYDTGYPEYASLLATRSDDLATMSGCYKALVPVLQRAEVDFYKDPSKALELIVAANDAYKGGVYTKATADYAVKTARELELDTNGGSEPIGALDPARVQRMLDIVGPIASEDGSPAKAGLKAGDLYTNQFIDRTITSK